MIGVLIIPTGIGATIGGHAGDANPVCKLLAGCCDTLITHPNVVNASDINEMPENVLYVEGSILDRFLKDEVNLEPVRTYNKILLACNKPISNQTINAVNAARITIGADIEIVELESKLRMVARFDQGLATGDVMGYMSLIGQIKDYNFDALAIHTVIDVKRNVALDYFKNGGINPWGGVEAKASKLIAKALMKPVAHAPLEDMDTKDSLQIINSAMNPRMAPEVISNCYLHCVLKGLHRAPRVSTGNRTKGISIDDVDWLVAPDGCWNVAQSACKKAGIPVIVVKENKTCLNINTEFSIDIQNYWEAAGYVMAMKAGIKPDSVRV